jgi:mannose-6-phosphate isomerase-like protein (cupin superfamily)
MNEIERIEVRGTTVGVRVATPSLTVTEHTVPAGFPGPPLHVHPVFDEVFVVLEGTLSMCVRDDVHEVGPGDSLHVSGSVPHTFANESGAPVTFLAVMSPGGFEHYFRALAAGDEAALAEVCERFGYAPAVPV